MKNEQRFLELFEVFFSAFSEDINSGIDDGTYSKADNKKNLELIAEGEKLLEEIKKENEGPRVYQVNLVSKSFQTKYVYASSPEEAEEIVEGDDWNEKEYMIDSEIEVTPAEVNVDFHPSNYVYTKDDCVRYSELGNIPNPENEERILDEGYNKELTTPHDHELDTPSDYNE